MGSERIVLDLAIWRLKQRWYLFLFLCKETGILFCFKWNEKSTFVKAEVYVLRGLKPESCHSGHKNQISVGTRIHEGQTLGM